MLQIKRKAQSKDWAFRFICCLSVNALLSRTNPPSRAASRVSVMTVKTSDTCSSRRRSQLVCKRMPGADKPVRARQRVLAGVGAQP